MRVIFVVVDIVGDVPRVTTETSTMGTGSFMTIGWSAALGDAALLSAFFGDDSFSLGFALANDADGDDAELDFELSSFANRRLVLRTAASFAFIYDSAELLPPRELTELLFPP